MQTESSESSSILSLRTLSALLRRAGWMGQAGLTYGGRRNVNEALGYADNITLAMYRDRYERGEVGGRIVDALPSATWRGGGEVYDDESPTVQTAFEKSWKALDERLQFWPVFKRADILAGLGRYSVILIGAPGELDEPLEKATADQILYLTPFSEEDAEIQMLELDPTNERFGQPTFYHIKRMTPSVNLSPSTISKRVHWSRVIHIVDGALDDHVYGLPRLQRIWNRLDDLDKVAGGGAEAFWKRADQGMQLDVDPAIKNTPEQLAALKDEVEEYIHGLKRIVRTKGVTMNTLGSDVANFNGPIDAIMTLISVGTGIPQRILMGSERGELASSQDKTNWDDKVTDRRRDFAEPHVRKMVRRLVEIGALPKHKDLVKVGWPEIKNLNDVQKGQLATQLAGLNAAAGETVILAEEIRDRVLEWPAFTDEQKAAIEAKKKEAEEKAAAEAQAAQDAALEQAEAVGKAAPVPAPGKPPFGKKAAPEDEDVLVQKKPKVKAAMSASQRSELRAALEAKDTALVRQLLAGAVATSVASIFEVNT